jgi:hypothetical protein
VVVHDALDTEFGEALLHPSMQSGIALPISRLESRLGVLFLCSRQRSFYNRARFQFLDSLAILAGGMICNAISLKAARSDLRSLKSSEREKEDIVLSLCDPLVATDRRDRITFFNRQAECKMGLPEESMGFELRPILRQFLDERLIGLVEEATAKNEPIAGAHGTYKLPDRFWNFSLNLSPITSGRRRFGGWTYHFSDRTGNSAEGTFFD